MGVIFNPIAKNKQEKRSNQLNDEIKDIQTSKTSDHLSSQSDNTKRASEFIFNAASKKGKFNVIMIFLVFGLIMSIYTIFFLETPVIFFLFLISIFVCLLFRSHLIIEVMASIKVYDKQIELKIHENNESIIFYPSEISHLRFYEVHSSNRGLKQLHGKMIELAFNETYLQYNQNEKLEKFKMLFCQMRPSDNAVTNPHYRLLNMTKGEIVLRWNEYNFFSGNKPIQSNDGRQFRKEILTFCVKNSIQILNEVDKENMLF